MRDWQNMASALKDTSEAIQLMVVLTYPGIDCTLTFAGRCDDIDNTHIG